MKITKVVSALVAVSFAVGGLAACSKSDDKSDDKTTTTEKQTTTTAADEQAAGCSEEELLDAAKQDATKFDAEPTGVEDPSCDGDLAIAIIDGQELDTSAFFEFDDGTWTVVSVTMGDGALGYCYGDVAWPAGFEELGQEYFCEGLPPQDGE